MSLGSIFGSSGGGPNFSGGTSYVNTLNNIGRNAYTQGQGAGNDYNFYNTQNMNALNSYSRFLQQNPATVQNVSQLTSQAENGLSEGGARSLANTEQSLAEHGISADSSGGRGAIATEQAQMGAANAATQAQIGEHEQSVRDQNLAQNANLWSGATNAAYGRDIGFNDAATNINQNLLSQADQLAIARYQAQQQQNAANDQLYGAIGSAAIGAFS